MKNIKPIDVVMAIIYDRQQKCSDLMVRAKVEKNNEYVEAHSKGQPVNLTPFSTDGIIVFNLSLSAIGTYGVTAITLPEGGGIKFTCRMRDQVVDIYIPVENIEGIYSSEGHGLWYHHPDGTNEYKIHPELIECLKELKGYVGENNGVSFSTLYDICGHYHEADTLRPILAVIRNKKTTEEETIRVHHTDFYDSEEGRLKLVIAGRSRWSEDSDISITFKYYPPTINLIEDTDCEYEVIDIFTRLDDSGKPLFHIPKGGILHISDMGLAVSMGTVVGSSEPPEQSKVFDSAPAAVTHGNVVAVDFSRKKMIK